MRQALGFLKQPLAVAATANGRVQRQHRDIKVVRFQITADEIENATHPNTDRQRPQRLPARKAQIEPSRAPGARLGVAGRIGMQHPGNCFCVQQECGVNVAVIIVRPPKHCFQDGIRSRSEKDSEEVVTRDLRQTGKLSGLLPGRLTSN